MWKIVRGPEEFASLMGYRAWLLVLESAAGETQRLEARITGTADATLSRTLPDQVAEAKLTMGRSAVERILSWGRLPPVIEIGSEWITVYHSNGYFSRVGRRLPEGLQGLEALAERARIRIPYWQGVEEVYEFKPGGRWTLRSFQNGVLRREEARMLSDVIAKLSSEQAQTARDLDPAGTAVLPPSQLSESEARVLRSSSRSSRSTPWKRFASSSPKARR